MLNFLKCCAVMQTGLNFTMYDKIEKEMMFSKMKSIT